MPTLTINDLPDNTHLIIIYKGTDNIITDMNNLSGKFQQWFGNKAILSITVEAKNYPVQRFNNISMFHGDVCITIPTGDSQ